MSKKSGSRSSSKRAKKAGSNVFDMFSQAQVAEFKEGFQYMDWDKDGVIGKTDLRASFDEIGRIASEEDLEEMLGDASGPINFTMFLNMFAEKQSGEVDEDAVVAKAFMAFADENGNVECDYFRHNLMTFGDKFTGKECDDAFDEMDIDENNMLDVEGVVAMLCSKAAAEGEA